jgi:ABC-type polysaccharide/polyol phosphate transport system ATPase subunit
MLPDGAIEVSHLYKRFHADRRRALLRDRLQGLRSRIARQARPKWRWVLQDINFRVEPGESLGIVGTNGSGKSTLLKMLNQIMFPYAGRVDVGGRIGALIEVRSGIHPDLSGRENTFLYGSLLGLPRRAVAARFDEIVDFAELSEAIDRQVKFYSSGMQMRLGFAIAAFLEPDVLLVDEVLAVGDASFQQKCLERMRVVLEGGTTLVLVTHDLSAFEATTERGIWLKDGLVAMDGPIRQTLAGYRDYIETHAVNHSGDSGPVRVTKVSISAVGGGVVRAEASAAIRLVLDSDQATDAKIFLGISEGAATPVFTVAESVSLPRSDSQIDCVLERLPLARGRYALWGGVYSVEGRALSEWRPLLTFDFAGADLAAAPRAVARLAPVVVKASWEHA